MPDALIVKDDLDARQVTDKVLQGKGFGMQETSNGIEAMELARSRAFDLVTMDVVTNRMDGVDTIAILRNEVDCPILGVSTHLSDELHKLGVRDFLQKPFGARDAEYVLADLLGSEAYPACTG